MITLTGTEGSILALLASIALKPEVLSSDTREKLFQTLGQGAQEIARVLMGEDPEEFSPEIVAAAGALSDWAKNMKTAENERE